MAPLRCAAKCDPFLSLDCAPTPSTLAQSKERKGSNFAIWQPCEGGPGSAHIRLSHREEEQHGVRGRHFPASAQGWVDKCNLDRLNESADLQSKLGMLGKSASRHLDHLKHALYRETHSLIELAGKPGSVMFSAFRDEGMSDGGESYVTFRFVYT